jgi:peptide/nickel transport system substrate-binding protein
MDGRRNPIAARRRRAFGIVAVAAGAVLLAAAPVSVSAQDAEPKSGGTLIFARNQEPATLDPIAAADNGAIFILNQVCDGLVQVGDSPTPVPALAESWTPSDDGLTWTFKLRDGAMFSDGTPVTAEDVKFSLDRWANPDIQKNYAGIASAADTVTIVDPSTIEITLERPDGAFLDGLAMFVASIVPQAAVESMGEEFGRAPVCSGPFKVTGWEQGVAIDLARNEHYWGTAPYLDGVRFEYIPDDNTRLLRIENGEADAVEDVPYAQVDRIDALDGISVASEPVMKWDAIWLNTTIPPLDDVNVRQALNHATPRQEILDSILAGRGTLANHVIARVKYWDESVPGYEYDLDKAKELMAASTVPEGFTLNLLTVAGDSVEQLMAEAIKEAWAEIGVDVQIEQTDATSAFNRWIFTWPNVDMAATFPGSALSSDTLSDDNLVFVFMDPEGGLHSFGTGWGNPAVVDLLRQASSSIDEAERASLFGQAQALAMADAPAVPLFFTDARTALSDDVKGFKTYPTGWWNLDEVWLDR